MGTGIPVPSDFIWVYYHIIEIAKEVKDIWIATRSEAAARVRSLVKA